MREKNNYFEVLRFWACIAVITIHVTAYVVVNRGLTFTNDWWIAIFLNSASRWAVPVFIMISGALLLEKDRKVNLIYRLIRIIIPIVFWGVFFYLLNLLVIGRLKAFSTHDLVSELLKGTTSYHMWYLYMLLGLYLILPIIKVFINYSSKKSIEYFLFLCFVLSGILPLLLMYRGIEMNLKASMAVWAVGYFVLGYYLSTYKLNSLLEKGIYFIGVISIFVAIYGTIQINDGVNFNEFFFRSGSITCIPMSLAVFLLGKNFLNKKNDIIEMLSINTFGIYLIHPCILTLLKKNLLGIDLFNIFGNAILDIPIAIYLIFIVSCLITMLLRKIKYLNKVVT
jgi:Uncharacterized protein conserved in bacteria